ncbi:hypothetical protein BH11MYX4_BH11MYX4_46470 [soil metagenome]
MITLGLAQSAHAEPAAAQPAAASQEKNLQEARLHFGRGVQLYRDRDFPGALAEFKRAYAIGPSFRILFNIGQAQLEVLDYAAAMDTFTRYLKGGGTEIPADKRAEVEDILTRCRERIAEVTVHATQPRAEIFVDDVSVGREPLAGPLLVSAGRHRLSAVVDGFPIAVRIIEVAGGDHPSVELAFVTPMAVVRPPAREESRPIGPAAPPHLAPSPSRVPFWISLGLTGAFGVATVTSGLLAVSARRSLDEELNRFPTDQDAVRGARQHLSTTALVTDVVGAATLLGVGATAYFALTTFKSPSKPAFGLGVGPGSIVAQGRFR